MRGNLNIYTKVPDKYMDNWDKYASIYSQYVNIIHISSHICRIKKSTGVFLQVKLLTINIEEDFIKNL